MEIKHKKAIGLIILAALIIPSILATVCYYRETGCGFKEDQEEELNLVPGVWTPELVKAYNNSDSIEMLEYSPFKGVVINGNCTAVKKLVIVAIPDWMESRGSFGTFIRVETWNDRNVFIGNSTKSLERELPVAYIFTDVNVSNALYNRYTEYQHPAITIEMTEIIGIDLTRESLDETVITNEIPCQIKLIPNHTLDEIEKTRLITGIKNDNQST